MAYLFTAQRVEIGENGAITDYNSKSCGAIIIKINEFASFLGFSSLCTTKIMTKGKKPILS